MGKFNWLGILECMENHKQSVWGTFYHQHMNDYHYAQVVTKSVDLTVQLKTSTSWNTRYYAWANLQLLLESHMVSRNRVSTGIGAVGADRTVRSLRVHIRKQVQFHRVLINCLYWGILLELVCPLQQSIWCWSNGSVWDWRRISKPPSKGDLRRSSWLMWNLPPRRK